MDNAKSPSAFIKNEPDDHFDLGHHPFTSPPPQQRFDMNSQQQQQHYNSAFGSQQPGDSIDPSELTMQGGSSLQNGGNFMQSYPSFGSSSNLAFMAHSGIGDDELLDITTMDDANPANQGYQTSNNQHHDHSSMPAMFGDQDQSEGIQMGQGQHMSHVYSQTPEGNPIQSPFIQQSFDYGQFHPLPSHRQQQLGQSVDTGLGGMGPRVRTDVHNGSFENGFASAKVRSKIHSGLERKTSQSRSPMTPKTPAMGIGAMGLGGTPDSGSLPSQPIRTNHLAHHRHQKSLSNQWDSNPGSVQSFIDSPLSSPGQHSHQPQISDILASGKHASLPAKVENGHGHHHPQTAPTTSGFQTQEAKRRRRRESHNMVERRRRDNINERIQELSHLVPTHRLEDEKVRKHLMNNSPLSPTLAATTSGTGMSPPQATSLLAGPNGRRAAGTITTGIPIEEKDKGPNKGDTLNGAVSWTRDLMWLLYTKLQQEAQLAEHIAALGGTFPFEPTEDEMRMRTEILDAIEKNGPDSFNYSRGPGSGLRVPKHTNIAGEPVNANNAAMHQQQQQQNGLQASTLSPSMSPAAQSSGSGGGQHWNGHGGGSSGRASIGFKEEDEYGMDVS